MIRVLAKDKNDERAIWDCGPAVGSHFRRPGLLIPQFYSREGMPQPLAGCYRDASAFLIASGPSFQLLDTAALSSVWTMTLNNACTTFRGNASCVVDDPSRFNFSMWLDPRIQKFVPMSHFEKPLWDNRLVHMDGEWVQRWEKSPLKVGDCPNVTGYRRNEKFHAPRWLYEDTINWGNHKKYGGGRSVLLAALRILFLLGFRRVYLLGVDFEMTPERRYHFPEDRPEPAIRGNMTTYAKLQEWLGQLQPYFLKEKFIVKNCNAESKLSAFPFMPFEQALEEARAPLGDFTRERTRGMYRNMADKLAECGQKPDEADELPSKGDAASSTPCADAVEVSQEKKPELYPDHRLGMKRLFVPEADAFNGAMMETPHGQLLVYRAAPACASVFVDEELRYIPGTHQKLDLWRNDDPRLFRSGDEWYVSTSYSGGGYRNERVELRRITITNRQVALKVIGKFETIEDDPGYVRVREKNWAPFSHEGRLLYVHKAKPHRILEVDAERGTVGLIHETPWELPAWWREEWGGELRLNTPPVRLDEERFLSTLHTYHRRGYRTWFYTFSAQPPFEVLGLGGAPVIVPEDAVGGNPRNHRHRCVFIHGLQINAGSGEVSISGGNNDAAIVVIPFRLSEVTAGLRGVGSGKLPELSLSRG